MLTLISLTLILLTLISLTLISLTLILLTLILVTFLSKILTFFTQHSQLRNSFGTHANDTNSTKWNFYTLFHNNIHITPKLLPEIHFQIFLSKNDFSTQTLGSPENHVKIFKNQNSNVTTQTHIQQTTFHQYTSFTKFLYFLRYGAISTSVPYIFRTSIFDLFDPKNPKIQSS